MSPALCSSAPLSAPRAAIRALRPTTALALLCVGGAAGCVGTDDAEKDSGAAIGGDDGGGGDGGVTYEEGCILVDGAGGYRWINDAIAVASPGSVIELCAAEGHEEAVVIDKAVSIVGPGSDSFGLVAPTNTVGFTITATGAQLSGVRVDSQRSGISVEAATPGDGPADVVVEDVQVMGAGNWGIRALGAEGLTIRSVVLAGNGYGGLDVEGGSVRVEASQIVDNVGYGVFADAGGTVVVSESAVTGTVATDPDAIADGHGMFGTGGSSIGAEGGEVSNNTFVNMFSEGGDLSIDGTQLYGALYGVVALSGAAVVSGATITDGAYHGLFLQGCTSVLVEGSVISGDPESTVNLSDATWGVADDTGAASYFGMGGFIISDDITIRESQFLGYNDGGLLIAGMSSAGAAAVIEDTQLIGNGRRGVYISGISTVATNMVVSGQLEVEDTGENRCLNVDQRGGIILLQAPLVMVGGGVLDNEGYGLTNVFGVFDGEGIEVAGNWCAGLMNFQGAMDVRGGDFSRPLNYALAASITDYEGLGLSVSDSVFHDSQTPGEDISEYDYGDYIAKYVFDVITGADIYAIRGARFEATNNTFVRGTVGMEIQETPATLVNNTWEDYVSDAVRVFSSSATLREATFSGMGSEGLYCYDSTVTVEDSSFQDSVEYNSSYSYYIDDVLQFTSESAGVSQAVYGNDCNLSFEGVAFSRLAGNAVSTYTSTAGSYVFADVLLEDINQHPTYGYSSALDFSAYYGTTDLILEGVELRNNGRDAGVEINNGAGSSSYTGTVNLAIDGLDIDGVLTEGLRISGDRIVADINNVTVADASVGLRLEYGVFTLDGIRAQGASGGTGLGAGAGMVFNGGSYTLGTGVSTLNETYGLACYNAPVADTCDGLDLAGNTLGDSLGCESLCPAVPE